jgi:hypothetical protein
MKKAFFLLTVLIGPVLAIAQDNIVESEVKYSGTKRNFKLDDLATRSATVAFYEDEIVLDRVKYMNAGAEKVEVFYTTKSFKTKAPNHLDNGECEIYVKKDPSADEAKIKKGSDSIFGESITKWNIKMEGIRKVQSFEIDRRRHNNKVPDGESYRARFTLTTKDSEPIGLWCWMDCYKNQTDDSCKSRMLDLVKASGLTGFPTKIDDKPATVTKKRTQVIGGK